MSKSIALFTVICCARFITLSIGDSLQDGAQASQGDDQDQQIDDQDQQGIVSILPTGCNMNDNTTVTCTGTDGSNIQDFINGISPDMTKFSMKFAIGGRVDLKYSAFPPFSALTSLEISTSNLDSIHTSTLQHLTKLKYLNLKSNHIQTLEPDIFYSCRSTLDVVDVSNNEIKLLDKNIFSPLEVLKHLDLSNNRLQSFASPFTSPSMNTLLLAGNPLRTATIGSTTKTYTCDLDLSFTEISVLQASMFSNVVCRAADKFQLSLRGDHITRVDPGLFNGFRKEFGNLSGCYLTEEVVKHFSLLGNTSFLGTLDISRNVIGSTSKSWPIYVEHVASISTMRTLNLSANGNNKGLVFDTVMPNLEVLDLSHNSIPIYQDSVVFTTGEFGNIAVPALRILKMTSAFQISSVMITPNGKQNVTWFDGLDKLEELYLDNNYKLYEASDDFHMATMFRGLGSLRNLSLARTSFGRRGFRKVELEDLFKAQRQSLINLDLSDNHISHRSLAILKGLEKLKVLDLRSNDIGYLTGDWYNPNLEKLYLSDNSLLAVSYSTMGEALNNHLQYMTIADNPFSCSCDLADFTAWLETYASPSPIRGKVHVPDIEYAKCMMPEQMEETPIIKYQPNSFSCNQMGIILLGISASLLFLALIALVITLSSKCTDIKFYLRTRKGQRVASTGVFMGYCEGYRGEEFRDNPEQAWVHQHIPNRIEWNPDLPVHITFMRSVRQDDDTSLLGHQIVDQHKQIRIILLIMGPLFMQHYSSDVITTVCANGNVMERCKKKFVLVLIRGLKKRDIPLGMASLKRCATCYELPDSNRGRNIFWKKLLMKLHKKDPGCC
jgi:Leucine-rich repeat (LRR) protein